MKRLVSIYTLIALFMTSMTVMIPKQPVIAAPSALIFEEDFETDGNGSRYAVSQVCNDNDSDYFTRTDGTDIGSDNNYIAPNNAFFWAAQDTNDPPCGLSVETIEWTGIDISGQSNLSFSGMFAEDDSSDGAEDWDSTSLVFVEVNIDGAGYVKILQFAPDQTATYNMEPLLDSDLDGIGDGPSLTPTFTAFSANIAGTGTSMSLRITIDRLNDGDEDIAFDYFRIETPTAVKLASFSATPVEGGIEVTWETATELDNLGFNLYRSTTPQGPFDQLNDTLIPTQNPGQVLGATYTWLDEGVASGGTYYYLLEDVDINGVITSHGPVSASMQSPTTVSLTGFAAYGSTLSTLALVAVGGLGVRTLKRRKK